MQQRTIKDSALQRETRDSFLLLGLVAVVTGTFSAMAMLAIWTLG